MPPKKLSKKQLEKQKAELEAQLAAERAAAECAAASEAERLRIIDEERARENAEKEKLRREEEAERLKAESEAFAPFKAHLVAAQKTVLDELIEHIDWSRYTLDSTLPDPSQEKELNSMMSEWSDVVSNNPEELLQTVERSAQVLHGMHKRIPELMDENKVDRVPWYRDRVHEMQIRNREMFERATELTLRQIESMADKERVVNKTIRTDNLTFSIWANLNPGAKFPRVLDFEDAQVTFDMPKLLSRSPFAIRCLQTTFDHICIDGDMPDHDDKRSLSGVLCFDFFHLPPFERPALHWKIQAIPFEFMKGAELNHTNAPTVSNDGKSLEIPQVLALNVKFQVQPYVLLRESPPRIGWWDHMAKKWSTEGVSNVQFNDQTREITCETTVFSPLAVVQSKSLDIPYRSWSLSPSGPNQAILSVEMKTHTLKIELNEHTAKLIQPDLPELVECFNTPLPPSSLAAALARSGFTVHPKDSDIEHVDTLVPKDPAVEKQLHEDMALMVAGFTFCGSVWNQAAGRNKCSIQVAEKPDWDIEPMTETYKTITHMWENEAMKIAYLTCSETAPVYKEGFETTHLRMEQVLDPTMPDQCREHVKASSVKFQECVRHMLDAVRVLSFC